MRLLSRGVVSATGFVWPLVMLSLVSLAFFGVGVYENHSLAFWYLTWNLLLGWLPLLFSLVLLRIIRTRGWTSWPGIGFSIFWVMFLPNSFYMVSDFIHLQDYQRVNVVFDAVMFSSFVLSGLLVGFSSLYLLHVELIKRLRPAGVWSVIAAVFGLCSFAIYIGRDLRMNSWDILTNPGAILMGVSDPFAAPREHELAFTTTLTFFIFLSVLYLTAWQLAKAIAHRGDTHLLYNRR